MYKIIYLFIGFSALLAFTHCKNEKKEETASSTPNSVVSDTKKSSDPLVIDLPPEYYHPPGLRPLNIVEMYNYGQANPDNLKTLSIKNKHGEPISHDALNDPEKPVFMQMYVNEEGKVVEAVIYELNDTIKNLMMNMRKTSK